MSRWVDEALPECASWQRDLIDKELDRRDKRIAELESLLTRVMVSMGTKRLPDALMLDIIKALKDK